MYSKKKTLYSLVHETTNRLFVIRGRVPAQTDLAGCEANIGLLEASWAAERGGNGMRAPVAKAT